MDAKIRLATEDDAAVLVDFNRAMAHETEDLDLPVAVIEPGVAAVLQDSDKGAYYVIELGGKVVAQLMVTLEWSDWRNGQYWWIQSAYVHPDYRRRGYFKLLYDHIRQEAKTSNGAGVRLYADNNNARANKTYEALGMTSHYKVYEELFR